MMVVRCSGGGIREDDWLISQPLLTRTIRRDQAEGGGRLLCQIITVNYRGEGECLALLVSPDDVICGQPLTSNYSY